MWVKVRAKVSVRLGCCEGDARVKGKLRVSDGDGEGQCVGQCKGDCEG